MASFMFCCYFGGSQPLSFLLKLTCSKSLFLAHRSPKRVTKLKTEILLFYDHHYLIVPILLVEESK